MKVEARITGQRRRIAEPLQLDPPSSPMPLSDLIRAVVAGEVDAFRLRQLDSQMLRVLTPDGIVRGARAGRIVSGGSELDQHVDLEQATATALEAFEDGLYFVFVDGKQIESLDDSVDIADDSTMMFVRLVPLAGG